MAKAQEKKKFYPVQIPLLKKEIELFGEQGKLQDRKIKLDLSNILKGKSLEIKFLVQDSEDKTIAVPKEIYIQTSQLRRMMRKGTDYVEDSFLAQCKDHRIRIKPFLITRKRVSKKVRKGLRETAKQEITNYVKTKTFEALLQEIMSNKFQKHLNPILKKVYPLGICEIRHILIEDPKEHEIYEEKQEQKTEQETKPEEEKNDTTNTGVN